MNRIIKDKMAHQTSSESLNIRCLPSSSSSSSYHQVITPIVYYVYVYLWRVIHTQTAGKEREREYKEWNDETRQETDMHNLLLLRCELDRGQVHLVVVVFVVGKKKKLQSREAYGAPSTDAIIPQGKERKGKEGGIHIYNKTLNFGMVGNIISVGRSVALASLQLITPANNKQLL